MLVGFATVTRPLQSPIVQVRECSIHVSPSSLTPRELEILQLIVDGHTNQQIARTLGISEKTVKTHCSRLFQRLGVSDRTQAAVWAMRNLPNNQGS